MQNGQGIEFPKALPNLNWVMVAPCHTKYELPLEKIIEGVGGDHIRVDRFDFMPSEKYPWGRYLCP